jgi:hypothetical protein
MSIHKAIDQIVEAFMPAMARISNMHESEDQKERHYKAWLRATCRNLPMTCGKSRPATKQRTPTKMVRPDPEPPLLGRRAIVGTLSGESHDQ